MINFIMTTEIRQREYKLDERRPKGKNNEKKEQILTPLYFLDSMTIECVVGINGKYLIEAI